MLTASTFLAANRCCWSSTTTNWRLKGLVTISVTAVCVCACVCVCVCVAQFADRVSGGSFRTLPQPTDRSVIRLEALEALCIKCSTSLLSQPNNNCEVKLNIVKRNEPITAPQETSNSWTRYSEQTKHHEFIALYSSFKTLSAGQTWKWSFTFLLHLGSGAVWRSRWPCWPPGPK